jgi:hypothetical protein
MTKESNPTLKEVAKITGTDYNYVREIVSAGLNNSRKQRKVLIAYRDLLQNKVNELTESILEEAITDFKQAQ